jgi:septal ring factor EnvC (AmiA/AmiB activator)
VCEDAARLELGSYMCCCLWVASVTKRTSIEQIEADITSAREALANTWTGIDKIHKELKSLADKVAKSKVRDTSRTDPWYKILRIYSTG